MAYKTCKLIDVDKPNLYRDIFTYSEFPKVVFDKKKVDYEIPDDIWITDFGISKQINDMKTRVVTVTHTNMNGGGIQGTEAYFAPELRVSLKDDDNDDDDDSSSSSDDESGNDGDIAGGESLVSATTNEHNKIKYKKADIFSLGLLFNEMLTGLSSSDLRKT